MKEQLARNSGLIVFLSFRRLYSSFIKIMFIVICQCHCRMKKRD